MSDTVRSVAIYEYRCRVCERQFELRRPMREATEAAPCPQGHDDTVRLLSMFSATGITPSSEPSAVGGGCCGGSCGCAS